MSTTEKVCMFGAGGSLVGIVTLPVETTRRTDLFAIVLNGGLVHRVGPFGMGTQLARRLAAEGLPVLRFDQSGLGDSAPREARDDAERAALDGKDAMDFAQERYGARRFIVIGLCSGALGAHVIAREDPRVSAICLLDGYAYRTRSFYQRVAMERLKDPTDWLPAARSLMRRARVELGLEAAPVSDRSSHRDKDQKDPRADIFSQDWPPATLVQGELNVMLQRGLRAMFIYTGGWSDFVDERQFDEMLPKLVRRDRVSVRYFSGADHTYLRCADRALMFDCVAEFARRVDG